MEVCVCVTKVVLYFGFTWVKKLLLMLMCVCVCPVESLPLTPKHSGMGREFWEGIHQNQSIMQILKVYVCVLGNNSGDRNLRSSMAGLGGIFCPRYQE